MSYIKRTKKTKKLDAHLNWMGGPSYDIADPLLRLRLAASSCFFGEPMYYHRDTGDKRRVRHRPPSRLNEEDLAYLRMTLQAVDPREWRDYTPAELLEKTIDEALTADAERTLQEAVRLRHTEHMRATPQVILTRAANHKSVKGTGLVRKYAPDIIARADEPATGLAYQLQRFSRPIPNALKKAWRDALAKFDDYQLAKYRLEGHEVKTIDVANLTHPKSAAVDKLMRGELRTTGKTWESLISANGSSADTWREALPMMGHMALLRNLRNLLKAGLEPDEFMPKLIEGAPKGQQLPFRYYSAYLAVGKDAPKSVLSGLEVCLMLTLGNLPQFPGRVMSLCDNSGSATSTTTSSLGSMRVASIGNLTGILTGMRADEGHVGIFGDRLSTFEVNKTQSLFKQTNKADKLGNGIGGGTENGIWLFWDQAIRNKEHWDTVFVYSDMQAGHGGLFGTDAKKYRDYIWRNRSEYIDVPKLIATYRAEVNPDVLVFLVQIAGYQDTLIPEFYDRTYILGGWGEGLLRFAAEMAELNDPVIVSEE